MIDSEPAPLNYAKPAVDGHGRPTLGTKEDASGDQSRRLSPTIRPYGVEDWWRLQVIHDEARQGELALAGLRDAFLPLKEAAEREGLFDGKVFVAELGGEVQGFAAIAGGELTWLYCAPRMQRRGIGRALIRHAVKHCRSNLRVEVLEGNTPALTLYLSEGFRTLGRNTGRLAGNEAFAASALYLEYSQA